MAPETGFEPVTR